LAVSQIEENDKVLEIGCSNGECSMLLGGTVLRGNGTLIGFDISPNMISEAKCKVQSELRGEHDRIQFHVMDPFSDPKGALTIMNKERVNVVLIDIGGNRDFESVLAMIQWVQSVCSARIIIIKSEGMISKIHNDSQKRSNDDTKRAKFENTIHITSKGVLSRGQEWFDSQYSKIGSKSKGGPPTYIHPLKAPISLSPIDNETPICRYYNYHANGCKKGSNECKFDHIHCHWCKAKGHTALECSKSM
jgi:SAM-dependent methyltransferase